MNFFTYSFALVVLVAAAFAAEQTDCPKVCAAVYAPICAQNRNGDQKTFSSQCVFEAYICKNKESGFAVYKNGKCSALEKDTECNDKCTMEYNPVCAMDRKGKSKTFPNLCEFKVFTCNNKGTGLVLFMDGVCPVTKKCNTMCLDEYKPVCARNPKGEFETFDSLCHFKNFICKNKNSGYELMKTGKCSAMKKDTECNDICTMEYMPVCAMNRNGESKTFPNICEFKAFTCKNKDSGLVLFKDGDCSPIKKDAQCNAMCTDEYKPVCAKNLKGELKTFSNLCHLDVFTCKNKNVGFELFKNGKCSATKTECNDMCTMEYMPVCAMNRNGESVTFPNFCEFEAFTCKNRDSGLVLFKDGECVVAKETENCPRMCPLNYQPICAKNRDGKFQTFPNVCEFEAFTCKNKNSGFELYNEGVCSIVKKEASCPRACPLNFDPICAKNRNGEFQTFDNECDFEAFTCKNKQSGYEFYKVGQCTEVKKMCPIACIAEYDPICTINRNGELQSFSNFCEFQMYKCNHNESELAFFRNALC